MASSQCYKSAEQTCNQGQEHQSFGQKISDMVGHVFKKDENHHHRHPEAKTQTQIHCVGQTNGHDQAHATTDSSCNMKCPGNGRIKKRGERKKGLIEKIKDGISGHSDSSSSSSSESDSDDDKCGKRKN